VVRSVVGQFRHRSSAEVSNPGRNVEARSRPNRTMVALIYRSGPTVGRSPPGGTPASLYLPHSTRHPSWGRRPHRIPTAPDPTAGNAPPDGAQVGRPHGPGSAQTAMRGPVRSDSVSCDRELRTTCVPVLRLTMANGYSWTTIQDMLCLALGRGGSGRVGAEARSSGVCQTRVEIWWLVSSRPRRRAPRRRPRPGPPAGPRRAASRPTMPCRPPTPRS
jgi:hypothetical protein